MKSEAREFYDKVARSWYNVRHWSIFREELEKLNYRWNGSLLNIGCAHGSDFVPFTPENFRFFGLDSSKELILLSKKYADKFSLKFHNCVADMRRLPFRKKSVDYIICIASLHHLLKRVERIRALEEMKRVLRKEAFITVWNRENPEFSGEKIIEKEWENEKLKRHYYLYNIGELKEDLESADFSAEVWEDDGKRNLMALLKLK